MGNRGKPIYQPVASKRLALFLFLICWLAYFSTYIGRLNYSAAMAQMISDSVLSKAEGGIIATVFFACYGGGQLINGFAADRLSPITMIFGGLVVSAGANFAMALPAGFLGLCAFWGINGLAQSMIWSPIIRIFSQLLPPEARLRAGIHINSTVPLGSLAAYFLSSAVLKNGSWQQLFIWASVCVMVMALIWAAFFIVKKSSFVITYQQVEKATVQNSAPKVKIAGILIASGVGMAMLPTAVHGMLKDGITTWFPTFLSEFHSTPANVAVLITAILPFINLSGAYIAGWLNSRFFKNEMTTAGVMFGLSAISLLLLSLFGQQSVIVFVLTSAIATTSMFGVNTMVISLVPLYFGSKGYASAITGILNSSAYIGSAISMSIFGGIAQNSGWGMVIMVWLGLAVLGTVLFFTCSKQWKKTIADMVM